MSVSFGPLHALDHYSSARTKSGMISLRSKRLRLLLQGFCCCSSSSAFSSVSVAQRLVRRQHPTATRNNNSDYWRLVASQYSKSFTSSSSDNQNHPLSTHLFNMPLHQAVPYDPPDWARPVLTNPPSHGRLLLANLPTPLYPLYTPTDNSKTQSSPLQQHLLESAIPALVKLKISLHVKRDDSSGGVELGGNKIRKLEFLLAEALARECDSVITIGGEQSNHCRATASAARMLGLEPHLILRTKKCASSSSNNNSILDDLVGNVLVDRMIGSRIYTCTPGEYGRIGSAQLVARLADHLQTNEGKRPYPIPVGGSNGLGSWGYIVGVQELLAQWVTQSDTPSLDHIVFACGSGGTAAGIALGVALAFGGGAAHQATLPTVHAIGVCDDPDYFYKFVARIADEMGFVSHEEGLTTEDFIRRHMVVHQGKGLGYAQSTADELDFVAQFAQATGMVLDPVYSGKALYQFVKVMEENPDDFRDSNVLFWHTGGALGMFDKVASLTSKVADISPVERLDVYGKGIGVDISKESS